MAALSLAILGKTSEPLYLREFYSENHEVSSASEEELLFGLQLSSSSSPSAEDDVCSVRQQFILHAALDRFDQMILGTGNQQQQPWRKSGAVGTDAMFVGLLCPVEDLRVYGYMTTTQIRFLLCVQDSGLASVDESIKRLMVRIHGFYVEHTLNPFKELNAPIQSKKFDEKVKQCVDAYNTSISKAH